MVSQLGVDVDLVVFLFGVSLCLFVGVVLRMRERGKSGNSKRESILNLNKYGCVCFLLDC